jgi:HK97 gp10 family phage protein
MAKSSFKVEGVPELARQLRKLGDVTREEIRGAIGLTVEAIAARARRRVRKRTGKGAASIRARVAKKGTSGRVTHPKRMIHLRFLEFGTQKMPAYPWLFPSAEEERQHHPARMRAALQRAQNKVAK